MAGLLEDTGPAPPVDVGTYEVQASCYNCGCRVFRFEVKRGMRAESYLHTKACTHCGCKTLTNITNAEILG